MTLFKDCADAGKQLAERLAPYASQHPLILALPRGGVPVAYQIAERLEAPLDTIVARKVGAPKNPELGVGAVAPGDVIVFDERSLRELGLTKDDLEATVVTELEEMGRRMERYESGAYVPETPAKTVIIVDDGLATGVSARAAIESIRLLRKPEQIIFAVPVCAQDAMEKVAGSVDAVVCLRESGDLGAIGLWYERFEQISDEEVIRLLGAVRERRLRAAIP